MSFHRLIAHRRGCTRAVVEKIFFEIRLRRCTVVSLIRYSIPFICYRTSYQASQSGVAVMCLLSRVVLLQKDTPLLVVKPRTWWCCHVAIVC